MNIVFQILAHGNNQRDALVPKPDLSAERAKRTFVLNIPGVSASLLVFVTFGTTRPFREHTYTAFVPACLRDRFSAVGAPQDLPYHNRESVAQRRHTSMCISKGIDTEVQLTDLAAKRSDQGPASPELKDDFGIPVQGGRPPNFY